VIFIACLLAVALALPEGRTVESGAFLGETFRPEVRASTVSLTWRPTELVIRLRRPLKPGERPKSCGTADRPESMFGGGGESMQVFLAPHPEEPGTFYQLAVNPSNVCYLAKGSDTTWRPARPIATRPYVAEGEWGVDFTVPFGAFGERPVKVGTRWRANFLGGGMWSPTSYCHNPFDFGELVFGGAFPRVDAAVREPRVKDGTLFEPDRFYYPADTARETVVGPFAGKQVSLRRLDGSPVDATLAPGEYALSVSDGERHVESQFEVEKPGVVDVEPDGTMPYYPVSGTADIGSRLVLRGVFGSVRWEEGDFLYDSSKPLCGAVETLSGQKELPVAFNRFAYEAQLGVRTRPGVSGAVTKEPVPSAFYTRIYRQLKPRFPHRTFTLQIDYPVDMARFAEACDAIEISFPGCSYAADPLDGIAGAFDCIRHYVGEKPVVFWLGGALPDRAAHRTADELNTAIRYTILRGGVGNMLHLGHGGVPETRMRLWDFMRGVERRVNAWYPAWVRGIEADLGLEAENGVTAAARRTADGHLVLAVNLSREPRRLSFSDPKTHGRRSVVLPGWGSVCLRLASAPPEAVDVRDFGARGDGTADDAAAIQRALDRKARPLVVRIPKGDYRIGRTLVVSGGTRIEADRSARIFLCDKVQHQEGDYLLTNAGSTNGTADADIAVVGGVWDGNSRRGTNVKPPNILQKNGWSGVLLNFRRVKGLTLKDLECANSVTYNVRLCEVDGFDIRGIRFSARERGWNQDGIHMNGFCLNGTVEDVCAVTKGQTADDLLAFNADDSMVRIENRGMVCGPISNVVCRNVFAEDCHSAIRFLSVRSPICDIRIENITAGCRCYAVNADAARYCLTPLFSESDVPTGVGDIRNVTVSNFTFWATTAQKQPLVALETNMRNFSLSGLRRDGTRDQGPDRPFLQLRNCAAATVVADGVSHEVPCRGAKVLPATPAEFSCRSKATGVQKGHTKCKRVTQECR